MKTFQFRSSMVGDEVLDFTTEASNTISALVNYLLENAEALECAKAEIIGVEEDTVYAPQALIRHPLGCSVYKFGDEKFYVDEYIAAEEIPDDD